MALRHLDAIPVFLVTFGCLLCPAGPCMADPQWQTGIAVGMLSAGGGATDAHLAPALDGTALMVSASIDRTVSARIDVGAEVATGADIRAVQSERTAMTIGAFNGRHRDTVLAGTVKANIWSVAFQNARPGTRFELTGVAGAGPAWRHSIREGVVSTLQPPIIATGTTEDFSKVVFAGVLGIDATAWVSPQAALLFTIRYNMLADDDRDTAGLVQTGAGSTIFRFGIGVRFGF